MTIYTNSTSETVTTVNTFNKVKTIITNNETLNLYQSSFTSTLVSIVKDILSNTSSTKVIAKLSSVESLVTSGNAVIASYLAVVDNLSILSVTNFNMYLTAFVNEVLNNSSIVINNSKMFSNVITLLSLIGTHLSTTNSLVSDTIVPQSTLVNVVNKLANSIETVALQSTPSAKSIIIAASSDNLSLANSVSNRAILKSLLEDNLTIFLPNIDAGSTYSTYSLYTSNKATGTYDNYNFNGSCVFNDSVLLFNKTGLYKESGTLDVTSKITASLKTAGLSFGTSNYKTVPTIYLGVSSDDNFILKVNVDGKGSFFYKLNKTTNNIGNRKVDLGKGLSGKFFQFELITNAETFNLNSLDFVPVTINRKI